MASVELRIKQFSTVGSLKDDCEMFHTNQAPDNAIRVQYGRLCRKVSTMFSRLDFWGRSDRESTINAIDEAVVYYSGNFGPNYVPSFLRALYHYNYKSIGTKTAIQQIIAPLLENNLKLDSSHGELAKTRILCLEIGDKDLPWDLTEVDW
jgi:hypothetical protein